ncbi:MAG: 4-hydroxy-tetrahydrodipicolinate reductase [Betaproteobacteria bacterium]|nr:4-hydroxy-tetrahydrodipicolinate reductase [Betaproteobacteria bacterium]
MTQLRLAIAGTGGRMGRALVEAISATPGVSLSAALEHSQSPFLGRDPGDWLGLSLGVKITDEIRSGIRQSQVLIDFTRPEATLCHLRYCLELGCAMVIGTTGFSEEEKRTIQAASDRIPIVLAPNMSIGVTVALDLLERATRLLPQNYDLEITEAHHRHKVDAPSGTALRMGEVVATARGWNLSDVAVFGREGRVGARDSRTIGFATVRGGDVVGDHTVSFMGEGERLEITHRASSRATFAQGAVRAAQFVVQQPAGIFDMRNVLGLDSI